MATQLANVTVPGPALTTALRRMRKLGRGTPGPATWALGSDGLKISWMGMSELLEGPGDGDAVMVIDGELMRGLARVSDWPPSVSVTATETGLKVGPMSFDAELRERPPQQLLALDSTPRDLVQLYVREAQEALAQAGLTDEVAAAVERLDRSCATAAKTLGWLGVGVDDVREWILGRMARPQPEQPGNLVIVEKTGQVCLFEDA